MKPKNVRWGNVNTFTINNLRIAQKQIYTKLTTVPQIRSLFRIFHIDRTENYEYLLWFLLFESFIAWIKSHDCLIYVRIVFSASLEMIIGVRKKNTNIHEIRSVETKFKIQKLRGSPFSVWQIDFQEWFKYSFFFSAFCNVPKESATC